MDDEKYYMMNGARSNKPVNRGARTVVICNTVPLDSGGMAYTIRVPCVINEQSIWKEFKETSVRELK